MIVVDTNVLAALLVQGPHTDRARALLEIDGEWHTERFALSELTNVLAAQVRLGRLVAAAAPPLLADAARVVADRLHEIDPSAALTLAVRHQVSAYDARFLGAAVMVQRKLVTEDAGLRRKAPTLTQSIDEALARH